MYILFFSFLPSSFSSFPDVYLGSFREPMPVVNALGRGSFQPHWRPIGGPLEAHSGPVSDPISGPLRAHCSPISTDSRPIFFRDSWTNFGIPKDF